MDKPYATAELAQLAEIRDMQAQLRAHRDADPVGFDQAMKDFFRPFPGKKGDLFA